MGAIASKITCASIVCPLFVQAQIKEYIKAPKITGVCEGTLPVIDDFPAQRASNAENVSIWWRHHVRNIVVCAYDGNAGSVFSATAG